MANEKKFKMWAIMPVLGLFGGILAYPVSEAQAEGISVEMAVSQTARTTANSFGSKSSVLSEKWNGLKKDVKGKWYYYINGQIARYYTGLVENENGWWYVKNGALDWKYTRLGENDYGWW